MLDPKQLTIITAIIASCLGISACGSTAVHSDTQASTTASTQRSSPTITPTGHAIATTTIPAPNASPDEVVAQVGGVSIKLGAIQHLMKVASAPSPVPDPPSYANCIANLRKEPQSLTTTTTPQSDAQLESACKSRYEHLLQTALNKTIHNGWLIGEAHELGLHVSDREVQQELDAGRKSFGTTAKFEEYRKTTGQTIADIKEELKVGKITEKIFQKIKAREHAIGSAEVADYYSSHRSQYAIPEGRAVRIVRTASKGSAIKVKQALESGKSFAAIVKELSAIGQPLRAKNGEVADLKPGVFEEKALNDAIFTAKFHRLYGPIQLTTTHKTIAPETNTGFFVFEVTHTVPGGQTPLGQVKDTIKETLKAAEKQQVVPPFVTAYRHRWKARTDCQPGYVVQQCKEFRGSKAEEAIDPYTL